MANKKSQNLIVSNSDLKDSLDISLNPTIFTKKAFFCRVFQHRSRNYQIFVGMPCFSPISQNGFDSSLVYRGCERKIVKFGIFYPCLSVRSPFRSVCSDCRRMDLQCMCCGFVFRYSRFHRLRRQLCSIFKTQDSGVPGSSYGPCVLPMQTAFKTQSLLYARLCHRGGGATYL